MNAPGGAPATIELLTKPSEPPANERPCSGAAPRPAREGRVDWFGLEPEAARGLAAGERDAFARLFDGAFGPVYGFVRRMVRDDSSAEDLTQDVFLKILEAVPRYRAEAPLRPWVFAIASNALRDHLAARASRERGGALAAGAEIEAQPADPGRGGSPSAHLEGSELSNRLERSLLRLPSTLREAVVLRHVHGLPFEEVASVLSISQEAVRQRCSRAMRELRRMLADVAGGGE